MGKTTLDKLKPHLLPLIFLFVAGWAVFGASLGHQFLSNWDDNKYVTANEVIRGVTPDHLKGAFSTFYVGNYAPVQMLSYMLDYSVWGLKASGFIFSNILLHLLNAMLLYGVMVSITGKRMGAFLAAAFFMLHPVQVESILWISQRKNLLAMFFFLLSLAGYMRYRRVASADYKSYAAVMGAFVLALLSKSVAVIAPLVFLFYDFCILDRGQRRYWLVNKLPFLAVAMAVAGIALVSQRPELGGGRTGYHGGSLLATLFTMLPVLASYLRLLVWPVGLSAVYGPAIKTYPDVDVVLAALLVFLLVGVCCYLYRKDRLLMFGVAVFFVGLLPVSQIVPLITLMNDRYLYFPLVGAGVVFGRLADRGGDALAGRGGNVILGTFCLLLVPLACLSFQRAKVWQDATTLWTDAVAKTPQSKIAWFGLGNALQNAESSELAIPAYEKALALDPVYRDALENISYLYLVRGEFGKARGYLEREVAMYPDNRDALMNLGASAYFLRDFRGAEIAFAKALYLKPRSAVILIVLANVNLRFGRQDLAANYYRQAVAIDKTSADILYGMGAYAALNGNTAAALDYLGRAVAAGYRDCVTISYDPDLDKLRPLPKLKQLVDNCCRRDNR